MPLRGNISSSLIELQHLNVLVTRFSLFGGNPIPAFIGSLKKLRHLDLSSSGFGGRVPHQLGNLSNLQYLDLSSNFDMHADKLEWLSHLSLLKYISLNQVNLTNATDWLQAVSQLPLLTDLYLRGCYLQSPSISLPVSFVNSSKSLVHLDLAENDLSDSIYTWFSNSGSSLVDLDLSQNKLKGPIPEYAFRNMSSLMSLLFSSNQIEDIPISFGNLCSLKTLSLEKNNLTGQLAHLFLNMSGCTKDSVETLILTDNKLSGSLPDFTTFSSLRELYISGNKLNGSFPESFQKPSNLTSIDLSKNQLGGSLPDLSGFISLVDLDISSNRLNGTLTKSIGQLSKIELLYLSSNLLEDIITETHLSNLSSLKLIDLSYNSFSFNFSSSWVPPFQLTVIKLRGCKLGPSFPNWLQTQNMFIALDISDAGISGSIPSWFWTQSPMLNSLNLSYNHLSGMLPDLSQKFEGYPGIDLTSNLFEGPIPPIPHNVTSLLLSRNMFSGSISFLCDLVGEYYMDLSDNQLSGQIPDCTFRRKNLIILNLASNNFSGKVPNTMDNSCTVQSLHLQNNNFFGELPSSLKFCTQLTVLEIGNNRFSGSFPSWIGDSLPSLTVFSFRSNQFHGDLPLQLCNLAMLQVLDLSQNSLSGTIPKCFNNLSAIAQKESSNTIITYLFPFSLTSGMSGDVADYQDEVSLVWKGLDSKYQNTLGLVKSIDLSSNKLSEEIPEEITSLVGLISLNLSRNHLTGPIPPMIGRLSMLNSIDLSKNLLTGGIPKSFSQLNALGVLNLSNNNLSGKIPSNTELQRFDDSAYKGNLRLCGFPLPNKCPGEVLQPPQINPTALHIDSEDGFINRGFYLSMVLGFILSFWGFCGTFLFIRSRRRAYFQFLDDIGGLIAMNVAKLQRKL